MCAVFILISVIIAMNPNALITTLMSLSWGAMAGAFLGPFIYGLFWKGTTLTSVWCSMIFGVGFVIINYFTKFTSPTIAAAAAMLASLIIVPLISFITPKQDKDFVEKAFECYNKTTEHRGDALAVKNRERI
jgi:SSS family solute:Na+ symporter